MPHFVLDARTATSHFPGIGRYVSNLARGMAPLLEGNERLTVLRPKGDPAHPLPLATLAAVQVLPVDVSPFSPAQQLVLPRLLERLRADLYHSAYFLMPYAPRPKGVPTLLTVYDLIPLLFPQQSTWRARLLVRWANGLALRAARRIIAISEATRRDYLARFRLPAEKILVAALAADPAFARQSPENVAAARARYGLPEDYLLYLGSNKPHKNLVRLVEAWARLQPQAMPLVVAGAWDDRYPAARQRAAALSLKTQIVWLGPVPEADLPALYGGAQVFVFPSLYEGFGLPVLEAMACGTPVICSNSSSLPEVAGDAALLVDPANAEALAEAMLRALQDEGLRLAMREQGLKRASRFSWTHTAQRSLEAYRSELAAHANRSHL
jgi:glycosyltransferase involved in cell wall biosynthesis